jgi:hypothetical protein
MTLARALRLVAVLIAIGGVADPAWTRSQSIAQPLRISVLDRPTLDLPEAGGSRRTLALATAERLRALLAQDSDVTVRMVAAGELAACPDAGACVLIGDSAPTAAVPPGAAVVAAVRIGALLSPNVSIAAIDPPVTGGLHAAGTVRVHLRGVNVAGVSRIEVADEGVVVGTAEHAWGGSSGTPENAVVDVTFVPLAIGARRLRVSVAALDGESTAIDNVADVGGTIGAAPIPVLTYEPEASWSGTFIRRALEQDARFALHGGTRLAPGIAVAHGGQRGLTAATLATARLVVVSGAHALGDAEVGLLDRFVRGSGGSVALLFDRRPEGPVTRLVPAMAASRELTSPQAVGTLRAAEIVTFAAAPAVQVLATHDGQPVILSRAIGRGRVVVSGALDSWRYRDGDRFGRFWMSVLNDAALAAGEPLDVDVNPPVLSPGATAHVRVRWRTFDTPVEDIQAAAEMTCGTTATPVRLWPDARPGEFRGTIQPDHDGRCDIRVTLRAANTIERLVPILVTPDAEPLRAEGADFAQALANYGAQVYQPGDEPRLSDAIRSQLSVARQDRRNYPFRSPWWLLPFAFALAGEWWMRRRAGLR